MVTTNSEEQYDLLKVLRNHGMTKTYYHTYIGHNSRLDEMQAAILRVKLKHLNSWIEMRRKNASLYNDLLKNVEGIELPKESEGVKHTYNQYTIKTKDRDDLKNHLQEKGIGSRVMYSPINKQKAYNLEGEYPVSNLVGEKGLWLP